MIPDYDKAATLAAVTLIRLGVFATPVFPEQLIRRCKNTHLMTWQSFCKLPDVVSNFPDGIDSPHPEAMTILYEYNGKCGWIVYYDPAMMTAERLRFSLAHEFGHIVMHHHGHNEAEEKEADFFAAHLLLPRALIAELNARDIPLLEVNLYNLSNASRACLWTMQQSEPAFVDPKYNFVLRQRFNRHLDNEIKEGVIWMRPSGPMSLYSLTSYMTGYKEG